SADRSSATQHVPTGISRPSRNARAPSDGRSPISHMTDTIENGNPGGNMIIDKAEVIVTSPGRNFVTLKVTTAEGHTGLGDATLNGRELAVVAYLSEHVVPLLIGADASRIEDTW